MIKDLFPINRSISLGFALAVFLCPALGYTAEENESLSCEGFLYRAKTENVPVYAEADETSEVLKKLKLGEKVCYVGEDNRSTSQQGRKRKFAVLDWRKESDGKRELAFSILTDLWPPKGGSKKGIKAVGPVGILQKAKNFMGRMRSGHPPTDTLGPYKDLIGSGDFSDGDQPSEGCSAEKEPNEEEACSLDNSKSSDKPTP